MNARSFVAPAAHAGAVVGLVALASTAATAQDPAFHSSLVGSYSVPGEVYADIWGDGDFAYVGHYGQARVDILDLTTPSNPTLAAVYNIAAPNNGASAQDVKVANGLLFIALESDPNDGIEIVDVRDPYNPTLLTLINANPGPYEQIHNVFYDQGWLYFCDSSNPSIAIVDLRSYDPDNAPATITTWDYELSGVGSTFVHDITVENGRLWASAWDSTYVYDVSNIENQAPQFMGKALGMSAHANWPTADGKFLVSTEERNGGGMRLYEIIDDGTTVEFVQTDSYCSPTSGAYGTYSAHNGLIVGDRVYLSNYSAGFLVLEIDRVSKTLEKVASYDSSVQPTNAYYGCWGVYPYLGEDKVILSDLEEGFRVIDLTALAVTTPYGRPTRLPPLTPSSVAISIEELGRTTDAATVELFSRVDGGAFSPVTMSAQGGGIYRGDLPGVPCGSRVDYYFSVDDTTGETFTKPAAAPTDYFTTWATDGLTPFFVDDFSTDTGWTVTDTGVSTGTWERVVPVESGAAPGEGNHYAPGPECYVTANGTVGGSIGEADLDGGPTRLTSPALDFSSGDGLIHYSRWLFNNTVDVDDILVEVSDDGGGTWSTVESVAGKAGGWIDQTFRVSDHVTPTAQVVVRFSATDAPNNSITEAAIDGFRAELFRCPQLVRASAVSRNGAGVNPSVYRSLTPPVIGSTWTAEIDTSGIPGATSSWIFAYDTPLPGLSSRFGEILVALPALGGQTLLRTVVAPTTGLDSHVIEVPDDPALAGFAAYTQGVVFGANVTLTNAVDLVIGY